MENHWENQDPCHFKDSSLWNVCSKFKVQWCHAEVVFTGGCWTCSINWIHLRNHVKKFSHLMHVLVKEPSTNTKLQAVFDSSLKSSSGVLFSLAPMTNWFSGELCTPPWWMCVFVFTYTAQPSPLACVAFIVHFTSHRMYVTCKSLYSESNQPTSCNTTVWSESPLQSLHHHLLPTCT